MQTRARLFEDLAKVAGGAAGTFAGLRQEFDALIRQQLDRILADMDMVPRDEFDAVKAMAAKARTEQEALARRVAELEQQLSGAKAKPKAAAKPKAKAAPKAE